MPGNTRQRRRLLAIDGEAGGELQRSDPIEAALEDDVEAPPEQAVFDPDDDVAEMLGEEYVRSVTSGEEQGVELRDEEVPEEWGGPFVETSGSKEFAGGVDASNPEDAEVEPLPLATRPRTRQLR